jgi:flagellin
MPKTKFKEEYIMRINQNISAMNTYSRLTAANTAKSNSLAKLSSGLRINKAGDDAAGLAISEKMRGQVGGLKQAIRNAQDGISLIQTAEGALTETHSILNRMRELAVQSANGTNTNDDRAEIQKEVDQLAQELTRIGNDTEFNTEKLLDGRYTTKFHIGANSRQNMDLDIGDMRADELGVGTTVAEEDAVEGAASTLTLGGVTFEAVAAGAAGNAIQIEFVDPGASGQELGIVVTDKIITVNLATGSGGSITSTVTEIVEAINEHAEASALVTASGVGSGAVSGAAAINMEGGIDEVVAGTTGINVSSQESANDAIDIIDAATAKVSAERSKLGATQNRLEHTINNLTATAENLAAAESRIRDVDMAEEMMEFTKNNILSQAATSMLAQANQMPQSVLQLLQ